ncbi:oxidoreductase [Polymorphobacter glacialis]|uniref:Oxidoreductase n=1 Tax=Sandarakinorhabdus glacialis TaxID=1614636 RepID=A0A916ZM32_9SPHN|nr:SDR family oxidoreductase [Polymorphobacter glacialis]GGE03775.1 oxidoreductase [Polymorphobacter glacialis]
MNIPGKSAIVTGAASGIGRASAVALAARGAARIVLVDVDAAGLAGTAAAMARHSAVVEQVVLDLADIGATADWFAGQGAVDILHNNAGVVSGAPQFPDADALRLHWIIDVNLTSLVTATQIMAQAMRDNGGGVIVNTVSTVALGTGFRDAMYATTKAGVMMFTRCCAPLKDDWNVRVAAVLPGLTDTPILFKTGADGAADWMAPVLANNERCSAEDIAEGVIDLVEDDGLGGGAWLAVRRIGGVVERQWGTHDSL